MSRPPYNPAATEAMWKCLSGNSPDYEGIITALDNGADPNALDCNECLLYRLATGIFAPEPSRLAAIRKLAEKGADINQRCFETSETYMRELKGESPLFRAAHVGNPITVDLLLELGADIHHLTTFNRTALFKTRNTESAIRLIEAGIDLSVRDQQGKTALETWPKDFRKDFFDALLALPPDMRKVNLYHRIYPHMSKEQQRNWPFDPSPVMRQAAASAARDSAVARYLANSTTQETRRP